MTFAARAIGRCRRRSSRIGAMHGMFVTSRYIWRRVGLSEKLGQAVMLYLPCAAFTCVAVGGRVLTQCRSCHEGVRHKVAIAGKACTTCHMPAVTLDENLRFANHWIGIFERGQTLRPGGQ